MGGAIVGVACCALWTGSTVVGGVVRGSLEGLEQPEEARRLPDRAARSRRRPESSRRCSSCAAPAGPAGDACCSFSKFFREIVTGTERIKKDRAGLCPTAQKSYL